MNNIKFLLELVKRGIKIWIDNDLLQVCIPEGALTPDIRDLLANNKGKIINSLHENSSNLNDFSLSVIRPDIDQRNRPFPLTDIQQAYWLGRKGLFALGNVSTHVYHEYESDDLDIVRLSKALNRLIGHHDMLRAIILENGEQKILKDVPYYEIKILDLRGQDPEIVVRQLENIRVKKSHEVLSSDKWPIFDICATRYDKDRIRLHISLDMLIVDFSSILLLFFQWFQVYKNPDIPLKRLELSFRDYVLAEKSLEKSELFNKSREYWFNRIDTLPQGPDLPLAQNPLSITKPWFTRRNSKLDTSTWKQLKHRAKDIGLTPSGILLASYAEVLTAWSKNSHYTINLTISKRLPLHPDVNEIIGDFTSMTLTEVNNSFNDTFMERAVRIQRQLWQDLDFTHYSGVQLLREFASRQDGSQRIMMPVIFTSGVGIDVFKSEKIDFNLFGKEIFSISQTPQVWLDHQVYELNGELIFNWDAVDELFPDGMLDDMFEAYCGLLKRLSSSKSIMNEKNMQLVPEKQLFIRDRINSVTMPIPDEILHSMFIKQVKAHPDNIAVITSHRTLTYLELFEKANQLGRMLREYGALPNRLVAVVMEKGCEQIVAAMGVLMSGAAYLPIDAKVPAERLNYLLEEGETNLVLTQSKFKESLEWPDTVSCFCVDNDNLAGFSTAPLELSQTPEDLAYVIYTSGSTGKPKGVVIDHRGAVNTIIDVNQRFGVNQKDRIFALSNLNFDLSVYDVFGILGAGGAIVIPDEEGVKDPSHWSELLIEHSVTIWNTVPALMNMLVEYANGDNIKIPDSLRLVLMSGDWIPVDLPDKIRSVVKDVTIISMGGATEASIWSILYPIEKVEKDWNSIPYGKAMINQQFHVLNNSLEPCPVWVTGELYIGGIGLAKGYWKDEEKTNARFIINPNTNERLYKTGDLGRFLPDGNIEFLGRNDFQVKIGGFRIELGEIEAAIKQHQAIKDVVVDIFEEGAQKRLIGYIVLNREIPNHNIEEEMIRFLEQKLPDYMIPATYIVLVSLPLTTNGKINRKALPAPENKAIAFTDQFIEPRTMTEKVISQIWTEALNLDKISILDNFFRIGGDSLLGVRINNRICESFSIDLPVRYLFQTQTVQGLARVIDDFKKMNKPDNSAKPFEDIVKISDSKEIIDLDKEAVLDPEIKPDTLPIFNIKENGPILLTGATGFLGVNLLSDLLKLTNADIYCLVRASKEEEGRERLKKSLESFYLWEENFKARIIPVIGDLSQPLLGLSEQKFDYLAGLIDVIYHNGAMVNHIYPYSLLKAANVLGTQEILRLASRVKRKSVHFLSSTAILGSGDNFRGGILMEDDELPDWRDLNYGGYSQSKWVSEKIVRIAISRGLPVSIYRTGFLSGHTKTGIANTDDFFCRWVKGTIQLQKMLNRESEFNFMFDMIPVDYASRAIVYLALQKKSLGKVFHLFNTNPISMKDLNEYIASLGCPFEYLSFDEYITALFNITPENALYSYLPAFREMVSIQGGMTASNLDCQNTLNGLAGSGLKCPPINKELLDTYFSFFYKSGFIETSKYISKDIVSEIALI